DWAHPLLVAALEDRGLSPLGDKLEFLLEEPLGEADDERDQLRDAHTGFRRDRDDPHVPREVAHPVVALGAEPEPVELFGDRVDPLVEELEVFGSRTADLLEERYRTLGFTPAPQQVDLGESDREGGLF